jgi:hypothetical protein
MVRYVLMDIEGTLISVAFVHESSSHSQNTVSRPSFRSGGTTQKYSNGP